MSKTRIGRGFDLRAAYIPITEDMRADITTMIQLTDVSTVRALLGYANSGNQHVNLILDKKKFKIREHFWNKFATALNKKLKGNTDDSS